MSTLLATALVAFALLAAVHAARTSRAEAKVIARRRRHHSRPPRG